MENIVFGVDWDHQDRNEKKKKKEEERKSKRWDKYELKKLPWA